MRLKRSKISHFSIDYLRSRAFFQDTISLFYRKYQFFILKFWLFKFLLLKYVEWVFSIRCLKIPCFYSKNNPIWQIKTVGPKNIYIDCTSLKLSVSIVCEMLIIWSGFECHNKIFLLLKVVICVYEYSSFLLKCLKSTTYTLTNKLITTLTVRIVCIGR